MKGKYGLLCLSLSMILVMASHTTEAQTVTADTSKTMLANDSAVNRDPETMVFERTEIEASVDAGFWRKHLEKIYWPI